MNKHQSTYTAQTWNGTELLDEIDGLSLDAAREICRANAVGKLVTRAIANEIDYSEIFKNGHLDRAGSFAETVYVTGA